jgi:hypothetical protein
VRARNEAGIILTKERREKGDTMQKKVSFAIIASLRFGLRALYRSEDRRTSAVYGTSTTVEGPVAFGGGHREKVKS